MLIRLQPDPGQLTPGGVGSTAGFAIGYGKACAPSGVALAAAARLAAALLVPGVAALAADDDALAVEEVRTGPLSSWQPGDEHPVAAEPTKVGAELPRLEVVTALAALAVVVLAAAVADPVTTAPNPSGSASNDSAARVLRTMLHFLGCMSAPHCGRYIPTRGTGRC